VPNWNCSGWGDCISGNQTEICEDLNNCGIDNNPGKTRSCDNCIPVWNCSKWSDCDSGNKTRTCEDSNKCGVDIGKPEESKSCEDGNSSWIYVVVIAFVVIALIALLGYFYFKNKGRGSVFESGVYVPPSGPIPPDTASTVPINPNNVNNISTPSLPQTTYTNAGI